MSIFKNCKTVISKKNKNIEMIEKDVEVGV